MKRQSFNKQSGATLMEVLVAMTISLVVTAAMIAMMSNTLGTTARIINMTKLQDDMRVAMQMMSRDVRRSSYNAGAIKCFANDDCGTDSSDLNGVDINLATDVHFSDDNSCFYFETDRNHDGDSTTDEVGGFRREVKNNENGVPVGVIQMWTGPEDETPNCEEDPTLGESNWVDVTNPESMNVVVFNVDDSLSYQQLLRRATLDDGTVRETWQRIRKINLNMQGQLVLDPTIQRTITDIIDVRNDLIFTTNS